MTKEEAVEILDHLQRPYHYDRSLKTHIDGCHCSCYILCDRCATEEGRAEKAALEAKNNMAAIQQIVDLLMERHHHEFTLDDLVGC